MSDLPDLEIDPVAIRSWRDLIAVGTESTLKNFLAMTEDPFIQRFRGVGLERVPSAGIESSISTPDLLLRELDVKASKYGLRPKAGIPAP